MINFSKIPGNLLLKAGAISSLGDIVSDKRAPATPVAVFLVDHYFRDAELVRGLPLDDCDRLVFVDSSSEPTTIGVNKIYDEMEGAQQKICCVVGIGGGSTLDTAKAISNLLGNGGRAEDYQGWDLLSKPGIFKIGVPTLSGTGAEASKTCVLMNEEKNLKLGMNSRFTVFDFLIMDPDLTGSVPRDQYFYTIMDTYIHCIESLNGAFRHPLADALSDQALKLVDAIMTSEDMMSENNRAQAVVASYLGGCAIGNSYVGLVHPLSAGLSMTLKTPHCLANCIVMNAMEDYYPTEYSAFMAFQSRQGISVPRGIAANLTESQYDRLYEASIVHRIPLENALGPEFKEKLPKETVTQIFKRM